VVDGDGGKAMNYDRYDFSEEAADLRRLLKKEHEENERLRAQLREVERITVGDVTIEVERREGDE
jgi:hypothetical protein